MHTIEPFFKWRDLYTADTDESSPFIGREYDEFGFTNTIYNYYIHPQWDDFGSETLYLKILFVDYNKHYAVIEFIGEWNDILYNDVMHLKRNIADHLIDKGITKFILIFDNVLNFHGDDDSYYQEWNEDIIEEGGWVFCFNIFDHVKDDMLEHNLNYYLQMPDEMNEIEWRVMKPDYLFNIIDSYLEIKSLN